MPDYVIGYSIGELCCGYVTGDFTIEQVIMSTYYIGLALEETKVTPVHYAMVDTDLNIYLSRADIKVIHNYNSNTSFINGTMESIKVFTKKLEVFIFLFEHTYIFCILNISNIY